MASNSADVEAGQGHRRISHFKTVLDQGVLTTDVINWNYDGSGTEEDPYVVEWIDDDPRNPFQWKSSTKWLYAITMAFATLAVSMVSSIYTGGIPYIMFEFNSSQEVATLGVSLFVLGFAIGPLFWAPLSELYGRQILYTISFGGFAAFNAGSAGSQNMATLVILRFFAGSFGSSPLTNAGGVIADMFYAKERGLATAIFASAPFMGPVLGPIIGGFLGESEGWRWIEGLTAIFAGAMWILGSVIVPETYSPVLLRKRANALSKLTGKVYMSRTDIDRGKVTATQAFKTGLSRPWILLFAEPIVLLLSIYMAVIYGTLYLLFGAYPYVYEGERGWSAGISGLAFVGVAIGMLFALIYIMTVDQLHYLKKVKQHGGFAPPEARLPAVIVGGAALPIGLFWFAWTNSPSLPWAASMAAGIPFGFGMVCIFLGILNYLVDSYTIFAASVLAANSVLRSLFGAVFPLLTTQMYDNLGIHWASSIPAFLALACLPFPFLFYKYGHSIRMKCKYAAEADAFMKKIRGQSAAEGAAASAGGEGASTIDISERDIEKREEEEEKEIEEEREELEAHSFDTERSKPNFERIKSHQSHASRTGRSIRGPSLEYEESNPYNLDYVNTRESFPEERARNRSRSRSVKSRTASKK